MIQAIETTYNGYRFRSRLEARWAVFFDSLGVRCEYEQEGFRLGKNRDVFYLPDFYVPEWRKYIEIKPKRDISEKKANEQALVDVIEKAGLLVQYSQKSVLSLWGNPWPGEYDVCLIVPSTDPGEVAPSKAAFNGCTGQFCLAAKSGRVYLYQYRFGAKKSEIEKRISRWARSRTLEERLQLPMVPLHLDLFAGEKGALMYLFNEGQIKELIEDGNSGIYGMVGGTLAAHEVAAPDTQLNRAYVAARQARFEHGETPKVQRGKKR